MLIVRGGEEAERAAGRLELLPLKLLPLKLLPLEVLPLELLPLAPKEAIASFACDATCFLRIWITPKSINRNW